ncbi:hypothetical protein NT01EI_0310 [Edwardsiella ictaluri 93-146]|uniref:Uncharacterized protein n=1 Tax=Edwardsiella ictaluri (strain 93-146) TaxID=634503 RepID=C5BCU6_EDWI9|nr:hypothetical protein NT01EI_0310 [Edwardsiella ictaluri 93-146]
MTFANHQYRELYLLINIRINEYLSNQDIDFICDAIRHEK